MKTRRIAVMLLAVMLALASFSPAAAAHDAAPGGAALAPATATTYTFTDPAPLNIPGTGEDAGYVLNVGGLTETVLDVNLYLHGLSSADVGELNILLVGPGGQNVLVFAAGCDGAVTNRELGFDDEAPITLPGPATPCDVDAVYQPGDFLGSNYAFGCVVASAPAPPYGASLSVFDGVDPNGVWTMWIASHCGGDADSSLSAGWTLEFIIEDPPGPDPNPDPGPASQVPAVAVPHLGLVMITAGMAQPAYESAAGGVLRGAGAAEIWLPADFDGNGFDTYVVTAVVEVEDEIWLGLFLGERNWGYVPFAAVIPLEAIPGTE